MSFVHISLLTLGGLFIAVPIVLHLAMRQKPKHQIFPALRFLQQRQVTNRRRLRLRQAALLMLRCLIVLVLALALARPSVDSNQIGSWLVAGLLGVLLVIVGWLATVAAVNRRGWPTVAILCLVAIGLVAGLVNSALALMRDQPAAMLGNRRAAVAAALIVDSSPRMAYRYDNQSRLERAKEVAHWLIRQFPADSQVALIDSSTTAPAFAVDLSAADVGADAIEVTFVPQPMSRLIESALDLLQGADKVRKELYIVSDMTRATWNDLSGSTIAQRLDESADVSLQIIDVGVDQPENTSLVDLRLSSAFLTPGSPVQIRAGVARTGGPENVAVELSIEAPDEATPLLVDGQLQTPPATVRGRRTVELSESGEATTRFSLSSLPKGTHHGHLSLVGVDGLSLDNRLDFTIHVRAPWSVLLAAGPGSEPLFVSERLAPLEFREQGRAKFHFDVVSIEELGQAKLLEYDAVGVLDPTPLDDRVWIQLGRFARQGGGVALFLGRNVRSASAFNSSAALEVLPAPIERQWNSPDGIALAPRDYDNPLLSVMRDYRTTIPWDAMPVFRHWVVENGAPESRSLIEFSNNKPAVLERRIGDGSILLVTTPVSDPDDPRRPPWNLLPTSLDSAWFLVLLDRLFLSLVQSNDTPLNYEVGQPAVLPIDSRTTERISLFTPLGSWLDLTSSRGQIQVPFTETPGTYRLNAPDSIDLPGGFSVNLPKSACRLDRIDTQQLDQTLGAGRYRYARTETEIVRDIDQSRVGREFYPFLLPLLVLVLAMEYVVSNRFYPDRASGPPTE